MKSGVDSSDRDSPGEKQGATDQTWESLVHKSRWTNRRRPNQGSARRETSEILLPGFCWVCSVLLLGLLHQILVSKFNNIYIFFSYWFCHFCCFTGLLAREFPLSLPHLILWLGKSVWFFLIHKLQAVCPLGSLFLQHFGSCSNSFQSAKKHKGKKSHLGPMPWFGVSPHAQSSKSLAGLIVFSSSVFGLCLNLMVKLFSLFSH